MSTGSSDAEIDLHDGLERMMAAEIKEAWSDVRPQGGQNSPHIDLYNFEEPEYEGSKYVLTSPRSLEACSKLGIKPVELLYQPLVDIQDDLVPRGVPVRTIYSVYKQTEKERQNKLALCREERERIMAASENDEETWTKAMKRVTIVDRATESADSGTEVDQEEDVNFGSPQRQRTAWTTSVGHERITREELEKRANELHQRALALRKVTLSMATNAKPQKSKAKSGSKKGLLKKSVAINKKNGSAPVKKPRVRYKNQ